MEPPDQQLEATGVYQTQTSSHLPHENIALEETLSSHDVSMVSQTHNSSTNGKESIGTVRGTSQTVEIASDIALHGLLPLSNDRNESNQVVIRDHVGGCIMVDLHGGTVKEGSSVQSSYLIDNQVIAQVSSGEHLIQPQISKSDDFHPLYVGSGDRSTRSDASANDFVDKLNAKHLDNVASSDKLNQQESRFVFHHLSEEEHPLQNFTQESQKENLDVKLEEEDDGLQPPRRKSARKARILWKNLEEEDTVRKINHLKRRKHYPLPANERGKSKTLKVEPPLTDIPVWAKYLTSLRIIDDNWIQGIAVSNENLQQTLEGHSRSILCDYIKSHPCNIEKRRSARSQECRVMWQHKHIAFDGIPFTIMSSDDLKCSFGMNYKAKKKKPKDDVEANAPEESPKGDGEKSTDANCTSGKSELPKSSTSPKKSYKDVMFTSCPAKITVKVIVKYPGYSVHPLSLRLERKVRLKALRADLSKQLAVEKEELYYIILPLKLVHNHPLTGRSRNIHPSIVTKVKELLQNGVMSPKAIKKHLDRYVQTVHGKDVVIPHPEDRAYYPKLKDISNMTYSHCKRMGIPTKKKTVGQSSELGDSQKRKRHKSSLSGEVDGQGCESGITGDLPLHASTLQEAVQTFCTDDSDRGSITVGEQDCNAVNPVISSTSNGVANLAEMVRGQLDSLRNITYTMNDSASLQELYQSLHGILNQYTPVNHQIIQGGIGTNANSAAFIIHESMMDPITVGEEHLHVGTVSESMSSSLTVPVKDADSVVTTAKFRSTQVVENNHLKQSKPPVALQCLTTNVVPTLTMIQPPPRSSEQESSQMVTGLPSQSTTDSPAVSLAQPSYQTVGPVTTNTSAIPVQLSFPPYLYYVQEVTIPETSLANPAINMR